MPRARKMPNCNMTRVCQRCQRCKAGVKQSHGSMWIWFVNQFRRTHPGLSYKQALEVAAPMYRRFKNENPDATLQDVINLRYN